VVQRGIVQILQSLIDPDFSSRSFGFRPYKGREHALACASALARRNGLWTWVTEDIRDAFNQVPLNRLLDVLRTKVPAEELLQLIESVIGGNGKRGLRQGGSLSPILLNVYLDHFLDRPWDKAHPEWPLIRVADDLLILTRNPEEAVEAHKALDRLLLAAAMPLKGASETTIRDLSRGENARWLGYVLQKADDDEVAVNLPDDSSCWHKLTENLRLAHESAHAPQRAWDGLVGWIAAQGPCYQHADRKAVFTKIAMIAKEFGIEELPLGAYGDALWADAYERWVRIKDEARGLFGFSSDGRLRQPYSIDAPTRTIGHREDTPWTPTSDVSPSPNVRDTNHEARSAPGECLSHYARNTGPPARTTRSSRQEPRFMTNRVPDGRLRIPRDHRSSRLTRASRTCHMNRVVLHLAINAAHHAGIAMAE
jgi:hypothetical protein